MILGRAPLKPVVWGLCPSLSSPRLAPPGRHLMSLNIRNAPCHVRDGSWAEERERLARRVIDAVAVDAQPARSDHR
jgi:phytoene dehydrogenase-like protein